jgi:hypothetical protein
MPLSNKEIEKIANAVAKKIKIKDMTKLLGLARGYEEYMRKLRDASGGVMADFGKAAKLYRVLR